MRTVLCCAIVLAVLFSPTAPARAASEPSSQEMRSRLDAIRARLPEFRKQLDELRSRGQDAAYPLVTFTVLDEFTNYATEDLRGTSPLYWGLQAVNGAK